MSTENSGNDPRKTWEKRGFTSQKGRKIFFVHTNKLQAAGETAAI